MNSTYSKTSDPHKLFNKINLKIRDKYVALLNRNI